MTTLNPYIRFQNDARAAMEFYQSVLGGDLNASSFGEFGMSTGEEDANLVMHAQLETPAGFTLMASDTPPSMPFEPGSRIAISLSGDDEDELRGYWNGLSDGASIALPLDKASWGDWFGQLEDRFGVTWMLNISGQ